LASSRQYLLHDDSKFSSPFCWALYLSFKEKVGISTRAGWRLIVAYRKKDFPALSPQGVPKKCDDDDDDDYKFTLQVLSIVHHHITLVAIMDKSIETFSQN